MPFNTTLGCVGISLIDILFKWITPESSRDIAPPLRHNYHCDARKFIESFRDILWVSDLNRRNSIVSNFALSGSDAQEVYELC